MDIIIFICILLGILSVLYIVDNYEVSFPYFEEEDENMTRYVKPQQYDGVDFRYVKPNIYEPRYKSYEASPCKPKLKTKSGMFVEIPEHPVIMTCNECSRAVREGDDMGGELDFRTGFKCNHCKKGT